MLSVQAILQGGWVTYFWEDAVQVHRGRRQRAQPQTEICTLTFEMPFANSLGDGCQVTEDKIVNTGTSVCSCAVTCVQDTLSQG